MADQEDDPDASPPPTAQGDPGDGASQIPAKRKIACLACRTIKLRCLFAAADSAPLDPCRRCKRLDLQCVYQPKRRPVKPVVVQQQGEKGKQEGRTVSPFEQDPAVLVDRQMSGNPSSSRTPYFTGQQQHLPGQPNKRRRLPGSEPGPGEEFAPSFAPTLADIYGAYPGSNRGIPQMVPGNGKAEHPGMIGTSLRFLLRVPFLREADTLRQTPTGNSSQRNPPSRWIRASIRSADETRRHRTSSNNNNNSATSPFCTAKTRRCIRNRYRSNHRRSSIRLRCTGIPFPLLRDPPRQPGRTVGSGHKTLPPTRPGKSFPVQGRRRRRSRREA